jgi:hypothetical protein
MRSTRETQGRPGNRFRLQRSTFCNLRTSCPALCYGCPVGVFGVGAANSLPPCGGGPGRGVAQTSQNVGLHKVLERSARPPSLTLPHKGGGNPRIQLVARIRVPRGANRVSLQRSMASPSCASTGQPWDKPGRDVGEGRTTQLHLRVRDFAFPRTALRETGARGAKLRHRRDWNNQAVCELNRDQFR